MHRKWYNRTMRQLQILVALALLCTGAAVNLHAQSAPKTAGFRDMFLDQLKDVETKVTGLVEAMPEEKYNWRPEEGVRSVKEVFMHIAFANYFLPSFIGAKPPAGISPAMEKASADKAKVLETVKSSFAHIRQVVTNLPDADLDKQTKFFGQEMTYREMLFFTANHMHEHLGQSIAYARTNHVTPPWSKKSD
jgi:uncharacterized damage-inducible protein DinB